MHFLFPPTIWFSFPQEFTLHLIFCPKLFHCFQFWILKITIILVVKKDNKNIFRLYFGPDLDFVTVCGIKGMVANCLCKRVFTVRHSTMYHSVQSSPPWAEHNTVDTNPYFAGHSNLFWHSRFQVWTILNIEEQEAMESFAFPDRINPLSTTHELKATREPMGHDKSLLMKCFVFVWCTSSAIYFPYFECFLYETRRA